MIDIKSISPAPWHRHEWTGDLISADGTSTEDFEKDDVFKVIAFGTTPDDWDGETAAVVELIDGRFVGWEANWGPTGNGFCYDAYGGTAALIFGKTVEAVLPYISDKGKELLDL